MRRYIGGGWGLLAVALLVRAVTALPFEQPGYMDAYYYYNVAERLHRGFGFSDPYLWNFLDNPAGIPHPACLYWMPLTSILIYPFFHLFGASYRAAQTPFVLLSALLPLLAYRLSLDFGGSRRDAWLAGGLMVLTGFYLPYWVAPDNFTPFALAAGLALYCSGRGLARRQWLWFPVAGVGAGLAHLARADGVLVLGVVVAAAAALLRSGAARSFHTAAVSAGSAVLAYGAVTGPWFYHNLRAVGAFLSPAGTRTLFLRGYDELFSYESLPSLTTFLDWGWPAILRSRLEGIGFGLVNLIAVNWMIFLGPLVLVGAWGLRRRLELLPVAAYGLLLYVAMTIGFTYPGIRGGLFHSSAALLPWFCVLAVAGLDRVVGFIARRRPGWRAEQARPAFGVGLLVLALLVSAVVYLRAAGVIQQPGWNQRDAGYPEVEQRLMELAGKGPRVMANNAPAYWYHSGRECVSIPNESPEVLLQAAARYGVHYLLLEADHPEPVSSLYAGDDFPPGYRLLADFTTLSTGRVRLFKLEAGDR